MPMDRRSLLLAASTALLMPNVALSAPGLHRRPPMISSNRLSKVGVCVHPAMGVAATTRAMSYLGLSRVRYDTPKALSAYETALCDAGLNVCGIIASFGDGTPRDMMAQLAVLRALEMRRPGSVSAIEGPNEVNNFPVHWAGTVDPKDGDMTHRMAAKGMVAALHTAVQADDVLRHIPTVGHTDTVPSSAMGAAYANMHVYAHDDGPLDWWLSVDGLAKLKAVNPGMPWFVTEWGDRLTNGKPQVQQAENVLQGRAHAHLHGHWRPLHLRPVRQRRRSLWALQRGRHAAPSRPSAQVAGGVPGRSDPVGGRTACAYRHLVG